MNAPNVDAITLEKGAHNSRKSGVCAMELVAWIAGEPHSDHPACTSSVLAAFFRRWNDDLDHAGRQRLKPFLPRLIGTAGDGQDEASKKLEPTKLSLQESAFALIEKLIDPAGARCEATGREPA